MSVYVTDTHALIWYAIGPSRKLGRHARTAFERTEQRLATIYVPVLVLVEIAEAMRRGTIRSDTGFRDWMDHLFSAGAFVPADLSSAVVAEAEAFYGIPERGDRLIAATAAALECPLISNDAAIVRHPRLTTVW